MPDRPAAWFDAFGQGMRTALGVAEATAVAFGHNFVGSEHLLIGLIEVDGPAREGIVGELSSAEARLAIEQIEGRGRPPATDKPGLTPRARLSLERAHDIASASGSGSVEPIHLLIALAELDADAMSSAVFRAADVDQDRLRERLWQALEGRPSA